MGHMADYTEEERETLRTAALSAITLVSKSEPGFIAMFKESMAGSKALAAAPPEIKQLIAAGGLPKPPSGTDLEGATVASLKSAVGILQAKSPEQLEGFRSVIRAACDEVANAAKGVSPEETAAIEKVKAALA